MFKKENILFIILGGFFVTNALIAEIIGTKLFSVEKIFGLDPANLSLFGQEGMSFNMTAGVLLWPVVFVMTDIINEYYGRKGVQLLSYLTAALISYAFLMIFLSMWVPPADFWLGSYPDIKPSIEVAYESIMGQGLLIILGSLVAFLVGQLTDVYAFHYLRRFTGEKMLWFRATGSTLISQLIDSFIVLGVAFYLPGTWPLSLFLAVGIVNYIYKFLVAVALTPALYVVHYAIDSYLGKEKAHELTTQAAKESSLTPLKR